MSGEYREAQAALYALGALPAEELHEFETALHGDLKCQLLLAELSAAADAMVATFPRPDPPADLKSKLLAAIDHQLADASLEADSIRAETAPWPNWFPWIFAAAFALLCVVLLFLGQSFRRQNAVLTQDLGELKEQSARLQTQRDALQAEFDQLNTNHVQLSSDFQNQVSQRTMDLDRQKIDLQKQLDKLKADSESQFSSFQRQLFQSAADKDRLKQELAGAIGSPNRDALAKLRVIMLKPAQEAPAKALASCVWDAAQQKGILVAEGLPSLPSGRAYQIWVYDAKAPAVPINAGVFNPDEHGAARVELARLAKRLEEPGRMSISAEQKGGAAAPGKMILGSNN